MFSDSEIIQSKIMVMHAMITNSDRQRAENLLGLDTESR